MKRLCDCTIPPFGKIESYRSFKRLCFPLNCIRQNVLKLVYWVINNPQTILFE